LSAILLVPVTSNGLADGITHPRITQRAPEVRVTDTIATTEATAVVQVSDPAAMHAQLQAKWEGMKDALRRGDIPAALTFIHSESRDRYEATFRRLTPAQLATIDQYLTTIHPVRIGPNGAEYEMHRTRDGRTLSYAVFFQVDADGVWRIRMF
jgi:hypothetical protein